MELRELVEEIVNMGEDICPCEIGIPCPYYNRIGNEYCQVNDCYQGLVEVIKQICQKLNE